MRNPDEDLRDLERRAAAGDVRAARLLQRELARRGLPQSDASRASLTRPELYLLCALRLWAGSNWAMGFGTPPASLQRAVRGVARRQGITTPELNRATKLLLEKGLIVQGGVRTGVWIRLTEAGVAASEACEGLELPPWDWRITFPRLGLDVSNWEQVAAAAIQLARLASSRPERREGWPGTAAGTGYGQSQRERTLDRIRVLMDAWSRTTVRPEERTTSGGAFSGAHGHEGTPDRIRFHFLYDLWNGIPVERAQELFARRMGGEDVESNPGTGDDDLLGLVRDVLVNKNDLHAWQRLLRTSVRRGFAVNALLSDGSNMTVLAADSVQGHVRIYYSDGHSLTLASYVAGIDLVPTHGMNPDENLQRSARHAFATRDPLQAARVLQDAIRRGDELLVREVQRVARGHMNELGGEIRRAEQRRADARVRVLHRELARWHALATSSDEAVFRFGKADTDYRPENDPFPTLARRLDVAAHLAHEEAAAERQAESIVRIRGASRNTFSGAPATVRRAFATGRWSVVNGRGEWGASDFDTSREALAYAKKVDFVRGDGVEILKRKCMQCGGALVPYPAHGVARCACGIEQAL